MKWKERKHAKYTREMNCTNGLIVFRQLYFTRKVAQQRCESTAQAMAGRAATKSKNSNTRRHTASMPTILARPVSPRNPQLSPLQVRSLLCQLRRITRRIHHPRTSLQFVLLWHAYHLHFVSHFSFLFSFLRFLSSFAVFVWAFAYSILIAWTITFQFLKSFFHVSAGSFAQ